jgi:hypothetical protein
MHWSYPDLCEAPSDWVPIIVQMMTEEYEATL